MDIQIQTEIIINEPKVPLRAKLARRIRQTYKYDTVFWRNSIAGPCGAGIFMLSLSAMGLPTGIGTLFDMLLFVLVGLSAFFITSHFIAVVLALIGLPIPRLYVGSMLSSVTLTFISFFIEDNKFTIALFVSLALMIASIIIGCLIALAMSQILHVYIKLATAAVLLCGILILSMIWPSTQESMMEDLQMDSVTEITSQNPSTPGSYQIHSFNYGSGYDIWQPEFGNHVDLKSESVDASPYITKWSKFRTLYWGYDQTSLPLNGRVWMPEGSGSFPLVLIVHGNHNMEDFSDDGYAYLGQLLASRGFITVSIDENFLNFSGWTGIPDNDMKTRAWILLKHLQQIDTFSQLADNPFYNKVDFSQIALIGHSRGGQAVAMAADYKRWFSQDSTLDSIESYQIQSVAAIAPTDKKIDGIYTRLTDTNYLTLQGARDGDVSTFDGERQYARTTFTSRSSDFKSTLYIADANHSQFNSGWGGHDISYPKGILLSRKGMLSPVEQREIAKVYISAFLEYTLHQKEQYLPLFQDYRTGIEWLPDTAYFNRYESGQFVSWARFDEDSNRMSIPKQGTATGKEVVWTEEEVKNRSQSGKGTRGALLERNGEETTASTYSISWENTAPSIPLAGMDESDRFLSFSLSDRSYELQSKLEEESESSLLELHIEIEGVDGVKSQVPLSQFMNISPLPEIRFTHLRWLDLHLSNGKYKQPTEAVFQTYMIPLSAFTEANPLLDLSGGIKRLSFEITGGSGLIMLDDIGLY